MPQPYEIVLNFRSKVPKHKQPQRSRMGCFNCRKFKKKCSEDRPVCLACDQRCIPCVWPKGKEAMPKDYVIPSPDPVLLSRKKRTAEVNREIRPKLSETPENVSLAPHQRPAMTNPSRGSSTEQLGKASHSVSSIGPNSSGRIDLIHDTLCALSDNDDFDWLAATNQNTKRNSSMTSTVSEQELRPYNETHIIHYEETLPLWRPVVTSRSETFITACAVGLISALAPQYTHPLLHASSTWTPFVKMNPVMERVAEACGCSFMAWKMPDLAPLAEKKYNAAFTELFGYLSNHSFQKKDHLWLGAALQLLAVGSKTVWSFRDKRRIDNLKGSWSLIKARIASVEKPDSQDLVELSHTPSDTSPVSSSSSKSPVPSPPSTIFEDGIVSSDYGNDNMKMEVENSLLHNEYKDDHDSRFERGWLEAFIYQYGMLLLIDDVDVLGLPNPFEVFTLVRKRIKKPLMNCDIAWMNHPVFGASFDAFELACKASYLMRHLDHEMTFIAAKKLYEAAQAYQLPQIPVNVNHNSPSYTHLRDSALMSEVVLRAVKILLRKIINLRIDETNKMIQRDIDSALHKLKQITRCGQVMGISSWPLLILGLAAVEQNDRDIIIDGCFQYAEVCQAKYIYTLIDTLEISWGLRGDTDTTARGLNILLERHILDKLIL